jgi:hypothetical protein
MTPLPVVSLELDRWVPVLGPSLLVAAYYQLENERRLDEWRQLLAPAATIVQAFDGRTVGTMPLVDRIEGSVEAMGDMHADVQWIRNLSTSAAVAETWVTGTLADGSPFRCEVIGKYEFDRDNLVERITVYHLHPGEIARSVGT